MAECLRYFPDDREKRDKLYATLWDILSRCKNKTPAGGDGSDGTVEHPDGRHDLKNDDKPGHWWHMLSDEDATELTNAWWLDNETMPKLARFQRIYATNIQHYKRADQLREQVRQSWARACRFDGIDPDASTIVFSPGNPHRLTYDASIADLRDHLNR